MIHKANLTSVLDRGAIGRRALLDEVAAGSIARVLDPVAAEADAEVNQDRRKARTRETQVVKTFHRVNRYPDEGSRC